MLETTSEHPFLTDDGLWIDAVELEIGEQVLSLDGDYGTVEDVVLVEDAKQAMYNLSVAEAHTFFVGEGEWVVHNEDWPYNQSAYNQSAWYNYLSQSFGASNVELVVPNVGSYGILRVDLWQTGTQAHHINQNAVYVGYIPLRQGQSVGLRGNAFTEVGSPHYNAHETIENFWGAFRSGGSQSHRIPINAEYDAAVRSSLYNARMTELEANTVADIGRQQRIDYGALDTDQVPRVPNRINQVPRCG